MSQATLPREQVPGGPSPTGSDRRVQSRFSVETQVMLARRAGGEKIAVQNRDLSWGGASLILPAGASDVGDSVVLEFPWCQNGSFSARAEVAWTRPVEDGRCIAGVRFSKLLVRDEDRLERLLSMLADPGRPDQPPLSLTERLELVFNDGDDMRATLEDLREGHMKVTSFRRYDLDQSILFALGGHGKPPVLRLRARVIGRSPAVVGKDCGEPGVYPIELAFEHPLDDLRRAVDYVIQRVKRSSEPVLLPAA